MYRKEENLISQWCDRMLDHREDCVVVGPWRSYPQQIIEVDQAMRGLVRTKGELFSHAVVGRRAALRIHPVVKRIRMLENLDYWAIEEFYASHKLSPYFEIMSREFREFRADVITGGYVDAAAANQWVDRIRQEALHSSFTAALSAQERSARKNARSALDYVDSLYRRYSRLCVVRVDLAYSAEYRQTPEGKSIAPKRVKRDLTAWLRALRLKFPSLVGYIWKLEYGPSKSYHVHVMALFNGHEIRQDVAIGKILGEYWREVVTKGEGGYWNCNANKAYYERFNGVGIGMVAHDDVEKRARLKHAILYLAKADYYARLNEPGIGRIFGKGQLPVDYRPGRPRASDRPAE
ncbi:TPA: inovirus-type Gp2 protein [Stenotrophomonas maltophilia]